MLVSLNNTKIKIEWNLILTQNPESDSLLIHNPPQGTQGKAPPGVVQLRRLEYSAGEAMQVRKCRRGSAGEVCRWGSAGEAVQVRCAGEPGVAMPFWIQEPLDNSFLILLGQVGTLWGLAEDYVFQNLAKICSVQNCVLTHLLINIIKKNGWKLGESISLPLESQKSVL